MIFPSAPVGLGAAGVSDTGCQLGHLRGEGRSEAIQPSPGSSIGPGQRKHNGFRGLGPGDAGLVALPRWKLDVSTSLLFLSSDYGR